MFITEIDGVDIHFIHVRSKHDNALPLIVTHGWPGSIIEQLKIIDPLTNPTAHGGNASDAFHLVIPSIPGFGFSGKPKGKGGARSHRSRLGRVDETARIHALRRPRRRLGLPGFECDGSPGAGRLARHPHQLAGDRAARSRCSARWRARAGGALREGTRRLQLTRYVLQDVSGLRGHHGHAAQAIGYSLADSLSGLRPGFHPNYNNGVRPNPRVLDRDDVLDDITLYWLTNTANVGRAPVLGDRRPKRRSSAAQKTSDIALPVAITVFPGDVYRAPETWARRAYEPDLFQRSRQRAGTSPRGSSPSCSRRAARCVSTAASARVRSLRCPPSANSTLLCRDRRRRR